MTTGFLHPFRIAACAIVLLSAVSGIAGARELPGAAPAPAPRLPVATASVNGHDEYVVRWALAGEKRVTVFAGSDPSVRKDRKLLFNAGEAGERVVGRLPWGKRWYFEIVPSKGRPVVVAPRLVHIPTVPNFRDLGGLATANGQQIRPGLLYRSAALDGVNAEGRKMLQSLELSAVVDLRYVMERERKPDPRIDGVKALVADVMADGVYDENVMSPDDWKMVREGNGAEMMQRLYRNFIILPSANHAFRNLLLLAATPSAPVLFHCTAGKDRTGWAAAVLLTILGVPRDQIVADYLMSNMLMEDAFRKEYGSDPESDVLGVSLDKWKPVLDARASYLLASFDEAERRYGSFDAYVRDGLGMDAQTLDALRAKMIEGEPAGAAPSIRPPSARSSRAASL